MTRGAPAASVPATPPGAADDARTPLPPPVMRAVPGGAAPAPALPPPAAAPPAAAPPVAAPVDPAPEPPAVDPAPEPVAGERAPGRRRGAGVREQRRLETRDRIVEAAAQLFAERGFDAVSVVEIAQRAGVVEKTVFNHFPVKEGLVLSTDPPMRAALLGAVASRPAGESVAAAAGTFLVSAMTQLGVPEAAEGVAAMARVVRGSRTLQVREREILGELTTALAAQIREETGAPAGAVEPELTASAVTALYGRLLELARDRVLAGVTGPDLAGELRAAGRRGLSLLQFGLAGYAKRR
ncbi:AcrR family transcriptional regulator [Geodermatophilus bullaregiensis]|uniref:TetR/AcrR family transcriptional regulator n=1 Tax=Geodermatophilus bullaregiensis TaxID=1564160 RepID=UPI0027DD6FFE|nr:helix-turn-helix domain-containing protein [Geodermatophilus bullaregiensis]MBM7804545.1 AcrR family transcriptional regulator [Geodermatophilus bullaregiensis]